MADGDGGGDEEAVAPTGRAEDATPAVSAVQLKLPPYWPTDPEVWFAQVEAQFATRNIRAQKTKFDHIVASLSPTFATEVRDLILRPPPENPFDVLKEQLIKRTAQSEQRKLQQLFSSEDLGDRKPTQFLRHLQQLLGERATTIDNTFLRELFLQRLPSSVKMVLASTPNTVSLENLAEIADKIMEVAPPTPTVGAVQLEQAPQFTSELQHLRSEVARLEDLIKSLTTNRRPRRSPTPNRPRPTTPINRPRPTTPTNPGNQPVDTDTLCWYHQRYGEAAQRCRKPCSWVSNTQATH